MPLILRTMPCLLCGAPLGSELALVAIPAVRLDSPRFAALQDAAMHDRCFAAWPDRPAFARVFFAARRRVANTSPFAASAYCDDGILVAVPIVAVETTRGCASITLEDEGPGPSVDLADWPRWLRRPDREDDADEPAWRAAAVRRARARLRAVVPDVAALLARVDRAACDARIAAWRRDEAAHEAAHDAARAAHELACDALAAAVARGEVRCPRCGHADRAFRRVTAPASFFVCPACKRSFDARDRA